MKSPVLFLIFAATAAAQSITLSSGKLIVSIDPGTGALQAIENKLTGTRYTLRDQPFRLTTTRGELTPFDCKLSEPSNDSQSATFRFTGNGLIVDIGYHVDAEASAIRKVFRVSNTANDPVTLFRVGMFDWTLPSEWPKGYPHSYNPAGINSIHFHKSGIWYDHPINLFLRDDSGGIFLGVENPFFEANCRALRKVYPATVEVSYRPNWILKPGESFEGDAGFFGVYRQEGIYAIPPARTYFGGRERMPFRILDWGEVWAMQAYMRSIMPRPPKDSYYSAYWGVADPGQLGKISRKKDKGEKLTREEEAMLQHFGGGPFSFREQELWYRLTPETVRFYKRVIDDAAALGHFQTLVVPNMMAGHSGWFESPEQKADSGTAATTDKWFSAPAFPLWKEVADYAKAKGMGMFTLELAGRSYRKDRPDWKYQDAGGNSSGANCYANRPYVEWYTNQVDQAVKTHPIRHWQWDEGWIDVLRGFIGEEARCYATDHGHPPGNIGYHLFRNVDFTLRTLKERHPQVQFVIISGLIRAMPWIMKNLDADSHTGAMEHSAWMDHNVYFLPPSRSHRRDGIQWILRNFSAGEEPADTGGWYSMLEDKTALDVYREKWNHWNAWASAHLDDLERRRDLFQQNGLQGASYARDDRAFLFIHNPADASRTGEISVNSWLGLEQHQQFAIRQRHPAQADFGVYAWGDSLTLNVASKQTIVLELESTPSPVARLLPTPPRDAQMEKAFLGLADIKALIEPQDLWPAQPLPGTGRMPTF